MTMLDRMRRHRNWLKWSLALVCLAFVIFYIPDFLNPTATTPGALPVDSVAEVDGEKINAEEFRRVYQGEIQQMRQQYGAQLSDQLLRQAGIDRQILQQLVDERAAIAEASRLGITVSDQEVAQRIYALPALQQNGVFIGATRYQQLLAAQRPPITPTEFENNIRKSLLAEKLRLTVTEWVSVSDKELEEEYRRRNDKVKLSVIAFRSDSYRADVTASDAEVATYFEGHLNQFRIPEKRKVKYVLVDVEALRAKITVAPADIERKYNETVQQNTPPEQIRASHILLRTEGKDEAAVKAKAESVLKEVKAPNADFAALAKKYSEDDSNAKNGGDLDFFTRGRMVPEFDAAAFALQTNGQVSELVKTEFGYHIIKLTDRKAPSVPKLDELKPQITEQLASERAATQAETMARAIAAAVKKPADLDAAARAQGLTVSETGFFARNEPILSVGSSPEMVAQAFALNVGDVSGVLRAGRGFVIEAVVDRKDTYSPSLEEVKDRVKEAVISDKALAMSKQKAAEALTKLKSAPDFEKAAKAANLEAKASEFLTRDGQLLELGTATEVVKTSFGLPVGAVSDPIPTANGTAIVKVLEKQQATDAELASAKDDFRREMLADRKGRFFGAYMVKAKQKMKIQVNNEALQKVIG